MCKIDNIFTGIPEDLPDERFDEILKTKGFRIERIVSKGHASPDGFWYDEGQTEWVILLKGHARLQLEDNDETIELTAGNYINIPAHVKHRVEWTDPDSETVWLAVHY